MPRQINTGVCIIEGCTNGARKRVNGHGQVRFNKLCHTHESQQKRDKNVINYLYENLRHHARRRGKEFTITIEEFTEFCVTTDYHNKKGRTAEGYQVDRIDPSKGYERSNIQVLTCSENAQKRFADYDIDNDPNAPQIRKLIAAYIELFGKCDFVPYVGNQYIRRDEEDNYPWP